MDNYRTCPKGTRLWILHLGTLEADEAYVLRHANAHKFISKNEPRRTRRLPIIAALIDHPEEGLILFDCGAAEDVEQAWGMAACDVSSRVEYTEEQRLPAAIAKTRNRIEDVKAIVIGHLHNDHAGGLEHFLGSKIPIYVHEKELKEAFWIMATHTPDAGGYGKEYLNFDLNWQTINESSCELFRGIFFHHTPGHTAGSCSLQVNLSTDGPFIFTSDHIHVHENWDGQPQGWQMRNFKSWQDSTSKLKRIQKLCDATVVFGHDEEVLQSLRRSPIFYS